MSSRRKQASRKASRKKRSTPKKVTIKVPIALGKGGANAKNKRGRVRSLPSPGFLGVRPKEGSKRNKMTMKGLTMNGGTVTGVTEISPNLFLSGSGQNVAGQILALIPLHPQLIAPGTRLSDVAAMYDQYVFTKIQFELDPSLPYSCGGRLLGFVERDATDPIGQMGTSVGNVAEWMDHGSTVDRPIQGGAGQAKLLFPRQSSYMHKIGKGPVGGYYLNKLAVSGSTTSTDINNCYQGQFVLMLHTQINSEGGQALTYPLPLGPLRVHWTLKFREAAERSQGQSGADKHLITTGAGSYNNPLSWSSTLTKQGTMLSWSSMGLQSRYATGGTVRGVSMSSYPSYTANFPVGFYVAWLSVEFSATGAADLHYRSAGNPSAGTNTQTGVQWIDWEETQATLSSTNITLQSYVQFEVLTPGELALFYAFGNNTGWTIDNYASVWIMSLPGSATTLLKHPNLMLRSLAFQKHVAKAGSGQAMAAQIRQELGLPPKEEKDDTLELAWKRILQDEAKQAEINNSAHLPRKQVDIWLEDKEPEDIEELGDYYESKMQDARFEADKLRGQQLKQLRQQMQPLRIIQDDEKSDRGKGAREQPRASSLKS